MKINFSCDHIIARIKDLVSVTESLENSLESKINNVQDLIENKINELEISIESKIESVVSKLDSVIENQSELLTELKVGKEYLAEALTSRNIEADLEEAFSSLSLKAKDLIESQIPEPKEYTPCYVIFNDNNYMFANNGVAQADKTQHILGYIEAGEVNEITTFYLLDPESGKYFYRNSVEHGGNDDWKLNEVALDTLDESNDRFKWYQANNNGQSRIINLEGGSKQKNSINNTDFGLHIYNWSNDWMNYSQPNVACGKGVQNGNSELNVTLSKI